MSIDCYTEKILNKLSTSRIDLLDLVDVLPTTLVTAMLRYEAMIKKTMNLERCHDFSYKPIPEKIVPTLTITTAPPPTSPESAGYRSVGGKPASMMERHCSSPTKSPKKQKKNDEDPVKITYEDVEAKKFAVLFGDRYIVEAKKNYAANKLLDAFHYLSLSHSTLLFHRLSQKIHRSKRLKNDNITVDENKELSCTRNQLSDSSVLHPTSVEETKLLLQNLPSDWTIVQVTSESKIDQEKPDWRKIKDPILTPTLYVSRCKCGPSPSVIIKKVNPPKDAKDVRSILEEMELIKAENKVISKNYSNNHQKYMSKREELNNRLRVLVRSMELAWLGHWSILFAGALAPNEENMITNIVKDAALKCKITLSDEQLSLIVLLVSAPSPCKSHTYLVPLDIPLRAWIATILVLNPRSEILKTFTTMINSSKMKYFKTKSFTRGPVILILDKSVVTLPWEMIQMLQDQPVTRMPSFQSLVFLYLHHTRQENSILVKGIDIQNGFYILDPEGNLPRSRERLKDCFASTAWDGVTASKPSVDQFKNALTSKDILVYVGHGSGSQYMPAQLVEAVDCHPLVLLYGCSSTSLSKRGAIPDPWGVVLNYLVASCPCVVGMLWEVMDKDTDLLTREMIRAMRGIPGPPNTPLEDPPTDVALLVAKARPLCSWYLISAALAVYGLPLQISPSSIS